MNALEALAAAIEKLQPSGEQWTYHSEIFEIRSNGVMVAENVMPPDGERIVMLHGTINAQLAILDEGVRTVERSCGFAITPDSRAVVGLARSILGTAT